MEHTVHQLKGIPRESVSFLSHMMVSLGKCWSNKRPHSWSNKQNRMGMSCERRRIAALLYQQCIESYSLLPTSASWSTGILSSFARIGFSLSWIASMVVIIVLSKVTTEQLFQQQRGMMGKNMQRRSFARCRGQPVRRVRLLPIFLVSESKLDRFTIFASSDPF